MSFITIEYYLFLTLVVLLIHSTGKRLSWLWLLIASYAFYAAIHIEYSLVMLVSTVIAYFTGRAMGSVLKGRWLFFSLGLLTDLSLLFYFKYLGFFLENVNDICGTNFDTAYSLATNIILPIGISFYTFQSLSYTIDIYRKRREPEKHFGYYALYISFFPQLVAGPIERSEYLIPQLKNKIKPSLDRIFQGGKLILWGLFKKIVIADTLAVYVSALYTNPENYNSLEMIIAVYAFAFQVYFDFSGYSNIAIGSAKMFGIDLSMNFNNPLTSKTISELWTKWHITLMTFFKTYIYNPIKSAGIFGKNGLVALMIVFVVSGLWHGSSWNFVLFGIINGLAIIIERKSGFLKMVKKKVEKGKLSTLANVALVFYTISLLSFSTIWFKSINFDHSITVLARIGDLDFFEIPYTRILYIIGLMIFGVWVDSKRENYQLSPIEKIKYSYGRASIYACMIALIVLFSNSQDVPFIYYQF